MIKSVLTSVAACLLILATSAPCATASERSTEVAAKLQGFDEHMQQLLKDWNGVAFGVGVVVDDKLVFSRGYGYRDYGKKLPFTPQTLFPIASNTKLVAAVSAGLLVDEGQLTWDEPVRESVPAIRFYNDELNRTVTLRDMLAHRTGVTRHDTIWYQSQLDNAELFDRLRYMDPSAPLRQTFLYNNMMYAAVGHIVALKSGKPWPDFVQERILAPLSMNATTFSLQTMTANADHAVPYTARRDSDELYQLPYEDTRGIAAAGGMISNIEDLSHWLIALMNEGRYDGRQVLPAAVLRATLERAIPVPDSAAEARGWRELLHPEQGMGRQMASYRGHLITYHGGDLGGFHSQISYLPDERVGVIVLLIGDHASSLYDPIGYNIYERILGLDTTPWSERLQEVRRKDRQVHQVARAKVDEGRVRGTKPSRALADFVGDYEHPAYGRLKIDRSGKALQFEFHGFRTVLNHYHYDRFDTPDDPRYGRYSVRFVTSPQGDADQVAMTVDDAETLFVRQPERLDPKTLAQLPGAYVDPTGREVWVTLLPDDTLSVQAVGGLPNVLQAYRGLKFRVAKVADVTYEFLADSGNIVALKLSGPEGVFTSTRRR
ncbi:serine hydrolase [Steroidobacter sp.]|uniref:serine hydrolase n=1 Tax=Steroidobacter sp. TaxID=1978227 RepID=UPI001A430E94|nr:serine hydrolase [Steroidobacter sp.]MBL8272095.1 serine hydrolase [Steroidobacter sp.]